ncbi:MAG TPA: aldo/keto reductase [Thermomicrobiales bacterium]|nr:aldo/keto reductase [Thermomicrobiales bacterium]
MTETIASTLTLNNGVAIPQLGFGVYQIPNDTVAGALQDAFAAGYRHVDTAAIYGNETGVGAGIARSGLPREELFVTTKLWNDKQGHDSTLKAFDRSLRQLGLDAIDLYLIHWPCPARGLFVETWKAMEELLAAGKIRAIGVSNFRVQDLETLLAETEVVPAVNQIELHPYLQQEELRAFHAEHGIVTEAWSPLGRGAVLDDPVIARIAAAHGKSPAQVMIRWHLQLGNSVIPKSSTPARIAENADVFGFSLPDAEMAEIAALDRGLRTGPDPSTFGN